MLCCQATHLLLESEIIVVIIIFFFITAQLYLCCQATQSAPGVRSKQASSSCFADLYPCCVARRHSLHRESEESFIHTSLEAVEGYMNDVIDSIVHSVPACPLALRIVLRNIYLKARLKWPHESHEVGQLLLVMLLLSWSCASCCATSTSRPASSGLMNSMRWVGCCW